MCMKNVNMNMVFCDIVTSSDNSNVSLGNVTGKKFEIILNNGQRIIPQISLALFLSATQSKNLKPIPEDKVNDIFSFDEKYDVKIRLTETISGDFKDLDVFSVNPAQNVVEDGLCRKTLNCMRFCIFPDIVLPEKNESERFAIKGLIRRKDENRYQDDGWVVQTILPIDVP